MRIIPAIDIINGKCVRLSQGDFTKLKMYHKDPLEVAKQLEDYGIKYLHLVDLDGARSNKIVNYNVLEKIALRTKLIVDFGGGVKSDSDIKIAFNSGASQITGGSIAVNKPDQFSKWINKYGSNKIILGADTNNDKIAINGWLEESNKDIIPFIRAYKEKGIRYVICTDISKDGMLQGPSFSLYKKIIKNIHGIHLIASGGVSSLDDLFILKEMGCEGVIIGKAIYENKISLPELKKFIINSL